MSHKLLLAAQETSNWLFNSIAEGVSLERVVHETSYTDFFLLNLTKNARPALRIVDISPVKEAKMGADWEWWFVDRNGYSLPFRVQAKVMSMDKDKRLHPNPLATPYFAQLHYGGSSKKKFSMGHQTNRLIRRAAIDKMFPIYCLYTSFSPTFSPKSSSCFCFPGSLSSFGVSIIGAIEVKYNNSHYLADHFEHVHAFECMFKESNSLLDMQQYVMNRWRRTKTRYYTQNYIRRPQEFPGVLMPFRQSNDVGEDFMSPLVLNLTSRITLFFIDSDDFIPLNEGFENLMSGKYLRELKI